MTTEETPQIYLVTPPDFDLGSFPAQLAHVLDTHDVACLRLSLATHDEDRLLRAADAIRDVAHAAEVALVIDTHVVLAERLGLDGVHLSDGARSVRAARKALGADAIVGAFCAQSRHDGMNAGEAGCDYIAFGPVAGQLGDGSVAEASLFEWWSEMIEIPVIAEGGLSEDAVRQLAPLTDFFAFRDEVWTQDDPSSALKTLVAAMA